MKTIHVKYKCKECGLGVVADSPIPSAECLVPARTESMDIKEWLDVVMIWVRDNHKAKSPDCSSKLVDLAIPFKGGKAPVGTVT